MVKIIPIVVFLLKFVVFTTQRNYHVQKLNEDFYNLGDLLNELGIKSKEHVSVLPIKPKDYVSKNKHLHSDEESQNFNLKALSALFKNDKSDTASIENNRLCKAGRCGCGRGGLRCTDNRDNKDVSIVYNDGVQQLLNELENDVNKYEPNESKNKLRCNSENGRCGHGRMGSDYMTNNDIIKRGTLIKELKHHGKKYKINDDVDAIVLDMSHLNELLGKLNSFCLDGKCNKDRNGELFQVGLNEVDKFGKGLKKIKSHVEAEVNDVTGEQADDALTKQVKTLLMKQSEKELSLNPEELLRYYQLYKTFIIEKVMDYVKNKDGRRTEVQNVTEKQKRLIDNVKQLSQNGGLALSEKEVKEQIAKIIFGKHSTSKVVPHNENNNNIYVPEWFYKKAVISKSVSNVRAQKQLLPLTLQQRQRKTKKIERFWRRNSGPNVENYGVPFEMQVQGLGQVIP